MNMEPFPDYESAPLNYTFQDEAEQAAPEWGRLVIIPSLCLSLEDQTLVPLQT